MMVSSYFQSTLTLGWSHCGFVSFAPMLDLLFLAQHFQDLHTRKLPGGRPVMEAQCQGWRLTVALGAANGACVSVCVCVCVRLYECVCTPRESQSGQTHMGMDGACELD